MIRMPESETAAGAPVDVAALEREAARLRAEALAAGLAAAGRWFARMIAGLGTRGRRTA